MIARRLTVSVETLVLLSLCLVACDKPRVINAPQLRTASSHPMQYYVSLPTGWSNARTWPVVVTIDGSSKEWLANANTFAAMRDFKKYPFIVVTPLVTTNGGRDIRHFKQYSYDSTVWDGVDLRGRCAFDIEGIEAVLGDVARLYRGETRSFLTGWSGGGHVAAAASLLHPEMFRATVLSDINFNGRCVDWGWETSGPKGEDRDPPPISTAAERVGYPIRFFNGTEDDGRDKLIAQQKQMADLAKQHGFTNFEFVNIKGAPHDPMAGPVLQYFNSLLSNDER